MAFVKGFIFMVNANGHFKSNISHKRNYHLLMVPMPLLWEDYGGLFGLIEGAY